MKSTLKSIPFVLLTIIVLFVVGMEMYGEIEGGVRLPQYFVSTPLMANIIIETLPFLLLLAMIFYGSELVWKSKTANFFAIENSTPFSNAALFISKFLTLIAIAFMLLFFCVILGVGFQFIYQYPVVDWRIYLSLFCYIGLPAALCGLFIVALQYLIRNKFLAISVGAIFLILTNSSLVKSFGFSHPLSRFANFIPASISDISGFDYLPKAFIINMLYSFFFVSFICVLVVIFLNKSLFRFNLKQKLALILPLALMIVAGFYINSKSKFTTKNEAKNWQQNYEEKYRTFKNFPQPSITVVKTTIDLYPEKNSYHIKGSYILVNKTSSEISELLVNAPRDFAWNLLTSPQLDLVKKDVEYGQYLFKLKRKIQPNDSVSLQFDFKYKIEPLRGHESFNAIVENGAFMRISRYFPAIGYQTDFEIEDKLERKKRNMPLQDELKKVDAPLENPYNYEFINYDAIISTSANQTAISVGELVNSFKENNRNFFHYKAENIPFRFGVSSAKYLIKKAKYKDIDIEILYDPKHFQNIDHLLKSIQNSMNYCENNFGKYPYKTFRFAEISNFTKGFAATAYPATIFINEKFFHLNLQKGEGQDVINELAGHELSHEWWGNAQLRPEYRSGSAVLTETLAQYTQLMLYKNEYGNWKMMEMVNLYKSLYESEKAFSGEEPLYTVNPDNTNVLYNKGLVKMYELYLLIGEEKINLALKNLLQKHKYPLQPATTLDLISELKAVSKNENLEQIDKIFKE